MSGIYIHIPFCKQACHYCDFHFSTSLKKKGELVAALMHEIAMRKTEMVSKPVETIYFGGGTPSLLTNAEIEAIIAAVYKNYTVAPNPEITLEANPDDLTPARILELKATPINRLSIGIQSFFAADLKLMNRAHNAQEASDCLTFATQHFDNISLDLIYGVPGASNAQWEANIDQALAFGVNHISSYALTVEPKTALASFIKKGVIENVDDEMAQQQFFILTDKLEAADFEHYELSNFGKSGYFSRNNSAYWQGKTYLGIGPSAHSFNGEQRSWNIKNNTKYIQAITEDRLPQEVETLSTTDKYNEYVMTGLRTIWGVSLERIRTDFGATFETYLLKQSDKHIKEQLLYIENEKLKVTKKGKFLSDGIASDLFKINI
ncbi:radical SAM family heme chaperone HemW [Bizionia gelidisalsuginis]|uniref:Heme chaperone HemW n=1 Tax=Bizionia gelidisalsuginis TaxID=291188 RepID=A0ABY3M8M1_9FLAO|nr:radical SAM family heme chaperone HemW [Bizionia gelidisalsuginis]TYC10601.1 radical SAM family heme chaperone HemW [Bizionia gelidisalsuginis]